jgi:hypothetical protein
MTFFNALLGIGTERAYAIELVADAVWRVYRLWSSIALGLARVTPGKTTSLAFAVTNHGDPHGRVSLSFPFNAPGYLIEAVPAESGTAFDVVRCPIANYFRGEAAIDLCSASWCNLDYALADRLVAPPCFHRLQRPESTVTSAFDSSSESMPPPMLVSMT